MVTGGQRESIQDLLVSIITGAQISIGAAQQAIENQGGVRGTIAAAKKRALESAIIKGPRDTINLLRGMAKSLGGTFGIQFSIASILKQSQIFTGTLGTIFQILGAFIDVMLAPFMPIFVRIIRRMVSWIPTIQEKAEQAAEWLDISLIRNKESVTATIVDAVFTALRNAPWKQIGTAIFNNPVFLGAMTGMMFGMLPGPISGIVGPRLGAGVGALIGAGAVNMGVDFQDQAVGRHLSEAVNADYAYTAIKTRSFPLYD